MYATQQGFAGPAHAILIPRTLPAAQLRAHVPRAATVRALLAAIGAIPLLIKTVLVHAAGQLVSPVLLRLAPEAAKEQIVMAMVMTRNAGIAMMLMPEFTQAVPIHSVNARQPVSPNLRVAK